MNLKTVLLTVTFVVMAMILSSCALNLFKPFDASKDVLGISKEALSESQNGNAKNAIDLSAKAFEIVGSGQFKLNGFYNAIVESDSQNATNSRKKLESLANFLYSTNSTNVALKFASQAMMESISKIMKIGWISALSSFSSTITTTSSNVNVNLIKGVETMLSLSHNTQLINLLESLSMTLHRFVPSNPNWLLSVGIYSFLEVPIVLFDSNDDDVLGVGDTIYSYLWNSSTDSFKENITSENYAHILNDVILGTYGNVKKSRFVIQRLSLTITAFNAALNEMIAFSTKSGDLIMSLRRYVGRLELAMYMLDPDKLSKLKYIGELLNLM